MLKKVLIVEDSEINREMLKKFLQDDYEILEATNGLEALDILLEKYDYISAILLDIVMPKMDGYEVLKFIRENPLTANIPVIVTTGNTNSADEVKALSLGANDYITKPYNPKVITHRLHNTIRFHEAAAIINTETRDELTGLYKRQAFFDIAEKMISEHEPGYFVLVCLNINNFKVINDKHGSEIGDQVLKFIGETLNKQFNEVDGVCCRMMSDVFAMIYPASTIDDSRVRETRKTISNVNGMVSPITFSVGRYIIEDLNLPVSSMYDRAKLASESISGRYDVNIAMYNESMRRSVLQEQAIRNEMEDALKNGEFEVWLQPQYNHSSGAIIGAEALVRWRHPKEGLIPPGVFIPIFERNGFIYEMDKYVWEITCMRLRKWIDEGRKPLPVSVNISRQDIFREDFFETLIGFVDKYEVPVDLLRLEITESAFAKSTEQIIEAVTRLIDMGFTLEIDDFGSGYSSLNILKDVPAQVLKLDMKFIEESNNSRRGGNILESVVRMSKWLGMAAIAEGVETIELAEYLKTIGCIYIQGYYYAKPMPVEEYEALARGIVKEEHLLTLETVETMNNSDFWDPKSMDTLIFNSYVGGACIVEFHDGIMETLRVNDKYARMLVGDEAVDLEEILSIKWNECVDEENLEKLIENINISIKSRQEVTFEIKFNSILGRKESTYLRMSIRVIASTGDHYLIYSITDNVSAQREAEIKEYESAKLLNAIMDNINGGVTASTIEDDQIGFLYSNDKYYEQLGYTREQYAREVKNPFDLLVAEDRNRVAMQTRNASIYNEGFNVNYRVTKRDGSIRWIMSTITMVSFPGVEGMVQLAVANDVTEQRVAEKNERRISERMQAIMANVANGIVAVTIDKNNEINMLFANDRYFDILGYTEWEYKDEVKDISTIIMEKDRTWVMEETNKIRETGEGKTIEYRVVLRNGKEAWVRNAMSVAYFEGIEDPVQLGVITDITVEKYTEQKIRENETQLIALNDTIRGDNDTLRTLMNDTPGGFARIRVFPDGIMEIRYINDGFKDIIGMEKAEIINEYGKDVLEVIHPDDVSIFLDAVNKTMKTGNKFNIKFRLKRKDGSYSMVLVFGRLTENKLGERYLNLYYNDASGEDKHSEYIIELIGNLPCGAGILKLEKRKLYAVYLNKKYWELVGRDGNQETNQLFLDAVHPYDQVEVLKELFDAAKQKRTMDCNVRIIREENQYVAFHMQGNINSQPGGEVLIYVVFSPLAIEESNNMIG